LRLNQGAVLDEVSNDQNCPKGNQDHALVTHWDEEEIVARMNQFFEALVINEQNGFSVSQE
jgi:hypothetical protein